MNGVRLAEIGIGDTVAVIGMGLVGQLVAQLARCQGGRVIAIDLRQERVDLARRLGAEHAILADDMVRERVASVTDGRGSDLVMIAAAAKSSQPSRLALDICRDRGRMVVLGAVDLSFPWNEMYLKEVQLFMSRAYGPGSYDAHYEHGGGDYPFSYVRWTENRNMEEFLRLIECGKVDVKSLVSHTFPLEEAARAYDTILNAKSGTLAVLLGYPEASREPYRPITKVEIGKSPPRSGSGTLGVALVGAGNLARWAHLPDVKKSRALELRAICSANGARGKSYALRFGASYCTSNLDDVLNDPTVQVVLITTRNEHHAGQAIAALRAGKHVFVEKPMALTEEECRDVCAAVRDTGCSLAVGFNRRFAPYYRRLKEQLAKRTGPAVVNARVNSPGIAGAYWMADPKIGGAILGEACHFVDLFHWLLGSEPTLVSAFSLPTDRSEPIGQNNLVASFRFNDGSIANLTYCTVGTATSGGERVEFFAPGVSAVTEDFKRLTISGSRRVQSSRWFAEKGYAAQLESFVEAIRAGSPPVPGERDGTRATIACLRMLQSARSEMPCAVDWEGVADALRSPDTGTERAVEVVGRGDEA
jgi:predicted dehydrogenase